MEKIILNGGTYGYKNFISEDEQNYFINWVESNQNLFKINYLNRSYFILKNVNEEIERQVQKLRERIIELDDIKNWIEEPTFYDYIGYNKTSGRIHEHIDPNIDGYIHTRWNIILKYPLEGGHSIYDNKINVLEERMIWKCEAGIVKHGSTPVIGDSHRITLSLGFQIKKDSKISKSFI